MITKQKKFQTSGTGAIKNNYRRAERERGGGSKGENNSESKNDRKGQAGLIIGSHFLWLSLYLLTGCREEGGILITATMLKHFPSNFKGL